MGSYLGRRGAPPPPPPGEGGADLPPRPAARPPSQALHQLHRVQHVHRAHPAPRLRPGRRPRDWDPANPASWGANEAWRRFPMRRPPNSIVGPLPADWWESYLKRTIWSLRHPRAVWSPVTVRITPRIPRGPPDPPPAQTLRPAAAPAPERPPDPQARETVLRVLRAARPARLRPEEPPSGVPSRPGGGQGSPEARASAFRPLGRSGSRAAFVPSLGPLSLGPRPPRRPRPCSRGASATSRPAGPLGSPRNAIASSYSSARGRPAPRRRRAPLRLPEWPVKTQSGPRRPRPGPPASAEPPAAPGSPAPRTEETPRLRSCPGSPLCLSPAPALARAVPLGDPASGTGAGLPWSHRTEEEAAAAGAPADPAPDDAQAAARPPLARTPPPAEDTEPQAAGPGPRAAPVSAGGAGTWGVHAPLGCSGPAPRPGPSAGAEPTAEVPPLTPAPPTASVSDPTRPPSPRQADPSPRAPLPPALTPAAPPADRTACGEDRGPAPPLPASAPPAAAAADPSAAPRGRPPPNDEAGGSLAPRIAATTAAWAPTFKPIFGSLEPLTARPARAPVPFQQPPPPPGPAAAAAAAPLLLPGPGPTGPEAPAPVRTLSAASSQPPGEVGGAGVAGAAGSTHSDPAPPHALLPGAPPAFQAPFSGPVPGFLFPAPQLPTVPLATAANIFSQVRPSAAQRPPGTGTAHVKGEGSPLSAAALVTPSQPAPALSAKPLFPLSLGAPPRPAFGASAGPRPGSRPPALSPNFRGSAASGSSAGVPATPAAAPAQPAFSGPTRSAFGALTPSASAFHVPTAAAGGLQTGAGSGPAGFPFAPASAPGLGVLPQARQSGAQTSVFGSTAPRPFAFGGLVTPMDCGESWDSMTVPDRSSSSGVFSMGAVPGGATPPGPPFGKGWGQHAPGLAPQNAPFAVGRPSVPARKMVFGGPAAAPFAHSLPVPRPGKTGSSFGLGIPSPPAQGSLGRGSFRPAVPSFSIGAKPKTPKSREPGHSRRHHAHKK